MDGGLSVWLPGDRIANVRGVREQHEMTDDDLDVGGVRYERVEPMRTWRITADADCEVLDLAGDTTPGSGRPGRLVVDLTFRSLTPARSDRKSTRLNSSHVKISYAVFCLKKENYG